MFCKNCGTKTEENSKFCINCGGKINNDISPTLNKEENNSQKLLSIDKTEQPLVFKSFLEKQIKKVGHISMIIGWIQISLIIIICLWSISDSNYSDSGLLNPGWFGFIITSGFGITMIVLGKQIKELKNIINNLWVLLSLSILMIVVAGVMGGGVGLITLIFIGYIGGGINKANKLKNHKYIEDSANEKTDNKVTTFDIFVYILIGVFILGILSSIVLASLNSKEQIDINTGQVRLSKKEIKNNDICNKKIIDSQWDGKNYGNDYLPVCVCKGELQISKDGLRCLNQDGICNEAYENTKSMGKDDKGSLNCDCKDTYKWNKEQTACYK